MEFRGYIISTNGIIICKPGFLYNSARKLRWEMVLKAFSMSKHGLTSLIEHGKYLIKTPFVPTVITVATGESGKVRSKVQPIRHRAWYPRIQPMNLLR
jgi:hypothetical protein